MNGFIFFQKPMSSFVGDEALELAKRMRIRSAYVQPDCPYRPVLTLGGPAYARGDATGYRLFGVDADGTCLLELHWKDTVSTKSVHIRDVSPVPNWGSPTFGGSDEDLERLLLEMAGLNLP